LNEWEWPDIIIRIFQSGVLTLFAIVTALSIFLYQQRKETIKVKRELNDRISRARNLVLVGIDEWYEWINSKAYLTEDKIPYNEKHLWVRKLS
jgi:hypothetical protein